jgi:hypothetical protein
MSNETILLLHPTFGVLGMIAAVWLFVDTLNASPSNVARIRSAAMVCAVLIWLAYIAGGYWYVMFYGADKAVILDGPWPFAHALFMETKEHLFFMVLLLATFLPIAATPNVVQRGASRSVVLWSSALVVLMGLGMEGAGAIISMGAKVGLLAKLAS